MSDEPDHSKLPGLPGLQGLKGLTRPPCDHADAWNLACSRNETSNLARCYIALNHAARAVPVATLYVSCGRLEESNGRVTWGVFLGKSADAKPWDCHQIYADRIEGRAQYEAANLRHFLGQGPKPDILAFNTDAPKCDCTNYNGGPCYNCINGAHHICGDGRGKCAAG